MLALSSSTPLSVRDFHLQCKCGSDDMACISIDYRTNNCTHCEINFCKVCNVHCNMHIYILQSLKKLGNFHRRIFLNICIYSAVSITRTIVQATKRVECI